mmetsp:Transcript_21462/g.43458  ORF Transcript_21462/g.43458 Transcript_21462/m.43458 type:complete len:222 (-) Transcript_21462:365-1030(-)
MQGSTQRLSAPGDITARDSCQVLMLVPSERGEAPSAVPKHHPPLVLLQPGFPSTYRHSERIVCGPDPNTVGAEVAAVAVKPLLNGGETLVAYSRGASVAAELVSAGWHGQLVLLSPILVGSEAVGEDSYTELCQLLKRATVPTVFAHGSSSDERTGIADELQEALAGLGMEPRIHSFDGDHEWITDHTEELRFLVAEVNHLTPSHFLTHQTTSPTSGNPTS